MTSKMQKTILVVGAEITILFGLALALGAHPSTSGPLVWMAGLVLPGADSAAFLAAETRLLAAISGGLLVGYGVALFLLAQRGLSRAPSLVRQVILGSIVAWFVVDSLGSIAAGVPVNTLMNIGFLAMFVLPFLGGLRQEQSA